MNETDDFSVKFGPHGFTLTYADKAGEIVYVFEVESPEVKKQLVLTRGGLIDGGRAPHTEDEFQRCAMAFDRTKKFLMDRGFDVTVFDPHRATT